MSAATKLPGELGPIHFVGIGGIGMSGIAEVLMTLGYRVQGSDSKASKITDRLVGLGAAVFEGQRAENLGDAAVVVVSSAIKPGNPELEEARRRKLPVVRRAEMLAELMRLKSNIAIAGTHGKTTTTTMVATLLDKGGFDPTVINGGVIHAYGSNARAGAGEWMVVEADESDGSFNRLPATIAIVTNIDPEHMDHWGTFDALRKGFFDFVSNVPFYGLAVCCTDHPEVQALVGRVTDRRIVTFGFNAQADVRAVNLRYASGVAQFDVVLQNENGALIEGMSLPMPGEPPILIDSPYKPAPYNILPLGLGPIAEEKSSKKKLYPWLWALGVTLPRGNRPTNTIPEPSTLALMAFGGAAVLPIILKRTRKK